MADKVTPADFRFRQDFDAYWPNYDHAPETCFRFVQRGLPDCEIAARMCRYRRVAVQAGGHAGFWPKRLSGLFRKVYAFEPEPILFECAKRNLKRWRVENVDLRPEALGAIEGDVQLKNHRSAGGATIDPEGTVPVRMTTIDALGLVALDALYLDIEGHEMKALMGALRTIAAFRPIIHVEMLPEYAKGLHAYLTRNRYRLVAEVHKDAIYRPEEQA